MKSPHVKLTGWSRAWRTALLMIPLASLASALVWLNRGPWWAWALLAGVLITLGASSMVWWRGRALRRIGTVLLAVVLVSGVAVAAHPGPQLRNAGGGDRQTTRMPVATREGPVTGVQNASGTVDVFAGVPYARPPVGELRWRPPQLAEKRSGVFAADRFSSAPIQGTSTFTARALSRIFELPLEETFQNPYPVSEDSLTLNVWRPSAPTPEPRPVLVYIPGGGFATGSGALPLYDGEALATRGDIITVTMNYRLGVFGFLSHPDLAQESDHDTSGNYGILDQIAALKWIRDNIAAFGGDPERVTVAGESAGGASVCILGATPLAEGLIDGIIGTSGACVGTTGDTERGDQSDDRATAEATGERLGDALDGATIDEMRAMSADRIRDAASPLDAHWRPSVDGYLLNRSPADIYASGDQLRVPLLTGSNADESSLALALPPDDDPAAYVAEIRESYGSDAETFLSLYPGKTPRQVIQSRLRAQTDSVMTRAHEFWAQTHAQTGDAPAWIYFFTRTPPDADLERYGAYHGAEVGYAFDNLEAVGDLQLTSVDLVLRDEMSGYWIDFVRSGDPNGDSHPKWPSVSEAPGQVMRFGDDGSEIGPRPRGDVIDFWLNYGGPIP